MTLDLDPEIAEIWLAYRLWVEGRVTWTELDMMSIDDVDLASRTFDAIYEKEDEEK